MRPETQEDHSRHFAELDLNGEQGSEGRAAWRLGQPPGGGGPGPRQQCQAHTHVRKWPVNKSRTKTQLRITAL